MNNSHYSSLMNNRKKGFTLLEMAIVLVIIAIIVGGVMATLSMMHTSKLRSVMMDVNNFRTAVTSFRQKYIYLPGDMKNAHGYWDDGSDGVCGTAAECNGDGDGEIDAGGEDLRAWQHLSLAEMLKGDYAGSGGFIIGETLPESKILNGGYLLRHININSKAANYIIFARINIDGVISGPDADYLDDIHDDRNPTTGSIMAEDAGNVPAESCVKSGRYALNKDKIDGCVIYFTLE